MNNVVISGLSGKGNREQLQHQLDTHRNFFVKTVNMQAMLQSKNNVFQSMLKNTEGKEGIDVSDLKTRMGKLNEVFASTIDDSRQLELKLQEALKSWGRFLDQQTKVMKWIQDAQILIAVKHIESKENVETHKAFFIENNDKLMQEFVNAAQDLEKFILEAEKVQLSGNISRLQEKWTEIQSFAPLHMMKVEFRLDEDTFSKYMKEVEKELNSESNSFHKNEDVASILKQHTAFFKSSGLLAKIEACLSNLSRLSRTFSEKMPENPVLQESYIKHKEHWDSLLSRIQGLYNQLQQIPEQWREYEERLVITSHILILILIFIFTSILFLILILIVILIIIFLS